MAFPIMHMEDRMKTTPRIAQALQKNSNAEKTQGNVNIRILLHLSCVGQQGDSVGDIDASRLRSGPAGGSREPMVTFK